VASMNGTLGTADASGDLLPEGSQSGLFNVGQQEGEKGWFARLSDERLIRLLPGSHLLSPPIPTGMDRCAGAPD
jgi:hypothetical protein